METLSPIIKGLSPGLTEIGKIKIGKKGEWNQNKTFQNPVKLDYFVITKLDRDGGGNFIEDTDLMNSLKQSQGLQKLTRIPITLLHNQLDLNFQCRYTCYHGKTRWCSGDGENATRQNSTKNGFDTVVCPCNRRDPEYIGDDKCKVSSCLSCVISGANAIGGVWKLRSTSYNTAVGILSSLALIMSQTRGILAGIPLELVTYPKMAADPKTGVQRKIQVVGIEFKGNINSLREEAYKLALEASKFGVNIQLVEQQAMRMLSVDSQIIDNEADYADEFYPEESEKAGPPALVTEPAAEPVKGKRKGKSDQVTTPAPEQKQDPTPAPTPEPDPEPDPEPEVPQLQAPDGVLDANFFGDDE